MVHLDTLIDVAVLFLSDFLGTSHGIRFGICFLIVSIFIPTRWSFHQVALWIGDLDAFDLTQQTFRVDHPSRLWGSFLERIFIV